MRQIPVDRIEDAGMSKKRIQPEDIISIPADETIKLVFATDREALIRFINSVFGKEYDVATERFSITNASFVDSETFDQIYGDLMFSIEGDFYHLEFQTAYDRTMTIRIFEYGAKKALETARAGTSEDPLVFVFPEPLVIYLEYNKNISSFLNAVLKLPGNRSIPFKIPIIKMYELSTKILIEKQWYLLLPFTLISHRKKLDLKKEHETHKREFIEAFRGLMAIISDLLATREISAYLAGVLIGATKHLAAYFNERYINDDEFGQEVINLMQSNVRTIIDDVRDEGIEIGELKKGVKATVNIIINWKCSISKAMNVAELDSKYRDDVISELIKEGIDFTDDSDSAE